MKYIQKEPPRFSFSEWNIFDSLPLEKKKIIWEEGADIVDLLIQKQSMDDEREMTFIMNKFNNNIVSSPSSEGQS